MITRDATANSLEGLVRQLREGCRSSSCSHDTRGGQHVNGPCYCGPRHIARQLRGMAESLEEQWKENARYRGNWPKVEEVSTGTEEPDLHPDFLLVQQMTRLGDGGEEE